MARTASCIADSANAEPSVIALAISNACGRPRIRRTYTVQVNGLQIGQVHRLELVQRKDEFQPSSPSCPSTSGRPLAIGTTAEQVSDYTAASTMMRSK